MNESYESVVPFTDIEVPAHGAWLGGMFEIGGWMGFSMSTQRRGLRQYLSTYPYLNLSDNSETRIKTIQKLFGGFVSRYSETSESWTWKTWGPRALFLASIFSKFAPSREDATAAFLEFEACTSREEKRQIALELKGSDRLELATTDSYRDLAKNPQFVAGVFDGRGMVRPKTNHAKGHEYHYTHMTINGTNRPLLEVLCENYGGTVSIVSTARPKVTIKGSETTIKNDSLKWELSEKDSADLADKISDHLLLKQTEVRSILGST